MSDIPLEEYRMLTREFLGRKISAELDSLQIPRDSVREEMETRLLNDVVNLQAKCLEVVLPHVEIMNLPREHRIQTFKLALKLSWDQTVPQFRELVTKEYAKKALYN